MGLGGSGTRRPAALALVHGVGREAQVCGAKPRVSALTASLRVALCGCGRLTSPAAILSFSQAVHPLAHPEAACRSELAKRKMSEPSITLSERAARRIVEILRTEDAALMRVSVEGGGCSGFQYRFDLVKEGAPDDILVERDGARVVVDPVSLGFVQRRGDRFRRRSDRRAVQDQESERHRGLRLRHELLDLARKRSPDAGRISARRPIFASLMSFPRKRNPVPLPSVACR